MGLLHGAYDAKAEGFVPGGASLHNSFSAHGPDRATFDRASTAELAPQKIADTLAFMFETRLVIRPTEFALRSLSNIPCFGDGGEYTQSLQIDSHRMCRASGICFRAMRPSCADRRCRSSP